MTTNINAMAWHEVLAICLKKFDYEKDFNVFSNQSLIRRLFRRLFGKAPKDPCPGWPSDSLAMTYVRKYNETIGGGKRIALSGADTLYVGVRYQAEDKLPVLSVVYYEDGTAYARRVKFLRGGGTMEVPTSGYMREITIDELPDRPLVGELCRIKKRLPGMISELKGALERC